MEQVSGEVHCSDQRLVCTTNKEQNSPKGLREKDKLIAPITVKVNDKKIELNCKEVQ